MARRSIFIAATGQHVGKTTTSIGLVSGLQRRVSRVGFIKPVGQRHIPVKSFDGGDINVDRDSQMIRDHFDLHHLDYADISPIVIDSGYTRKFLDGSTDGVWHMRNKVQAAFNNVAVACDYTVIEGTGHMGVGSIVGMNNATVAKMLGVDVVLVASGGVGSAFDEIALNMQLCQAIGVGVRGVVLNKVRADKLEMIRKYMELALREWGVPLLGCVPFSQTLASPSLRHLTGLLSADIVSAGAAHDRVFSEHHLVATSLDMFYALLSRMQGPDVLIITPAARNDVILATIAKWTDQPNIKGALVLTGSKAPGAGIVERLCRAEIPAIYTSKPTFEVMTRIVNFTPKTGIEDKERIQTAIELVEKNIDFDNLIGPSDLFSMACMPDLHTWSSGVLHL